jgi:cytochrome P450 family 103
MSMALLEKLPEFPIEIPKGTDIYRFVRHLRETSPLAQGPFNQVIALHHRHFELITSPSTRQWEDEFLLEQGITTGPIYESNRNGVLFANGDAHTRRRTPLARTFAFKLMDSMRPRITAIVSGMVRKHLGKPSVDFLNEIAAILPALIIAEVLGVPESDLPVFLQFIPAAAESLAPIAPGRREPIERSLTDFQAYVQNLINVRRQKPADDFLSRLVAETDKALELTETEVREQVAALIVAGSDTTRGTLCMTLSTLLQHPEQWKAFCADPDRLKRNVVQEGLRFEPVVGGIPRIATEDLDIDGHNVPSGSILVFSVISALRDPETYASPETFNIHRTDHPKWHPIFGAGAHRCLGEALARAELEEALVAIARLAPNTSLIGAPPKLSDIGLRQVDQMQVRFA